MRTNSVLLSRSCHHEYWSAAIETLPFGFNPGSRTKRLCFRASPSFAAFQESEDLKTGSQAGKAEAHKHRDRSPSGGVICFGMLVDLPLRVTIRERTPTIRSLIPLVLDDDNSTLHILGESQEFGCLDIRTGEVLGRLRAESGISLQISCVMTTSKPGIWPYQQLHGREWQSEATLCVNIYGPEILFEDIGAFASKCMLFLQDPRNCDREVIYRNPHRLAFGTSSMTYTRSEPSHGTLSPEIEDFGGSLDPFDISDLTKDLPETEPAKILRTSLYPYQKQALTFMLRREQGWALNEGYNDVWRLEIDRQGQRRYINNVTGEWQQDSPSNFRGGLLADAMGLGKTLTVIALIASTLKEYSNTKMRSDRHARYPKRRPIIKTTLIVVPLSLLETWKAQLKSHTDGQSLKWHVFHGSKRVKDVTELGSYEIVVTTYHTVSSEWNGSRSLRKRQGRHLHDIHWRRVVLDEAHIIRESSTELAQSVFALNASRRWAVSGISHLCAGRNYGVTRHRAGGTPLQNKLTDLCGLFRFLRVYPFDDPDVIKRLVVQDWSSRPDTERIARLRTLLSFITLRRPKKLIDLPARKDEIHYLTFTPEERERYDIVKAQTIHKLDLALDRSRANNCINALQWITTLRLICNHGTGTNSPSFDTFVENTEWNEEIAAKAFEHLLDTEEAICQQCNQDLSPRLTEALEDEAISQGHIQICQSFLLLCASCFGQRPRTPEQYLPICTHMPKCFQPGSVADTSPNSSDQVQDNSTTPTKVQSLMADLFNLDHGRKCVVFSYWTKTLDMIEKELHSYSIQYSRYDGGLSTIKRAQALQPFSNSPEIVVLLASLSCGGIGLDLTAASKVYIMEPQWNPMVEEQALDRVHRFGQTKDVTTVRYIIKDTWEENIIALQKKKRALGQYMFLEDNTNEANPGQSRLQYLKSLVEPGSESP